MTFFSRRTDLIKQYRRELDTAMLAGPDAVLAFMKHHGLPLPSSRDVLEISFHKSVTGSRSLPMDFRRNSKTWLVERGYQSWDDGDV